MLPPVAASASQAPPPPTTPAPPVYLAWQNRLQRGGGGGRRLQNKTLPDGESPEQGGAAAGSAGRTLLRGDVSLPGQETGQEGMRNARRLFRCVGGRIQLSPLVNTSGPGCPACPAELLPAQLTIPTTFPLLQSSPSPSGWQKCVCPPPGGTEMHCPPPMPLQDREMGGLCWPKRVRVTPQLMGGDTQQEAAGTRETPTVLVEAEKGLWWRFGAAFCSPPQKGGHFLGAATASFRDQNSITSSHLAGYTGKHSLHTSRRNRHRVWRRGSVGRAPHLPAADPRPVPSRLCSSVGKKKHPCLALEGRLPVRAR